MATDTQERHSAEEKFFGIATTIETPPKNKVKDDEGPDYDLEIDEEESPPEKKASSDKDDGKAASKKPSDDDLSDLELSERVQKRVNHLTWEREEAKREAKRAMEIQQEAIRAAQALSQRNQEYENIISTGEAELVERIKRAAASTAEMARLDYRQAYETGDTERMLEAHEKLIAAQTELREAQNYDANYQQRRAMAQEHQRRAQMMPRQQPAPPPPRKPTPEAQSWNQENPWFGDPRHRDMTAIALATHETLIRDRGFQPDTPAYYEELNSTMRSRFPEYFNSDGQSASASGRKPATVVASARRGNPPPSRKVKLTPTQVTLAKKLGLTLEQYADQVIKGQAND